MFFMRNFIQKYLEVVNYFCDIYHPYYIQLSHLHILNHLVLQTWQCVIEIIIYKVWEKIFIFLIFLTGISSASETFLIVFSSETNSKAKLGNPIPSMFLLIESRLGWFLNLLIDCCRNCILRASNTNFHGDILVAQTANDFTEVIFPSSNKSIMSLWENLSEKIGLTVFQKFLL